MIESVFTVVAILVLFVALPALIVYIVYRRRLARYLIPIEETE